jgi:7-cyano-7-deazaguanine synthase
MKALVVFSGGQDSTTCLYYALRSGIYDEVRALTINYGQRHRLEIDAAVRIAALEDISHEIVDVGQILEGTSPLVSGQEVETYASADVLPGGIEKTFVPLRNTLFLTIAANRAVVHGCHDIYTGICEEDYGGYPDCRESFRRSLNVAINMSLEGITDVLIRAPLMTLTKKETVEFAASLPGCMEALAYSHTCYNGVFPPCGKCHACHLRQRGFEQAGIEDPLLARAAATAAK